MKGFADSESEPVRLSVRKNIYAGLVLMARENRTDVSHYVREIVEDFVLEHRNNKPLKTPDWAYADRNDVSDFEDT
jgi:hypothetical protein